MERIQEIVKKNAENFGLVLVELRIQGDNIEAVLYRMNGELTTYDLERLTMLIRKDLEVLNIGEQYNINLSSPGLDRILKQREELDIFAGREVQFTYKEEEKTVTKEGILKGNRNNDVIFETESGELSVPFEKLNKVSLFCKDLFKRKGGKK